MSELSVGYIIDICSSSSYSNNYNIVKKIKIHNLNFCIRRVEQFEWGQPIIDWLAIDEEPFSNYRVYKTVEEAESYIRKVKGIIYNKSDECIE